MFDIGFEVFKHDLSWGSEKEASNESEEKIEHYGHDQLKITAISRFGFEPIKLLARPLGRLVLLLKTNIRTLIYFEYASTRDRPSWAYMPRAFLGLGMSWMEGMIGQMEWNIDGEDGVTYRA